MLLPNTSLLSVLKAKTGQTPQQGAKSNAQKNATKIAPQTKEVQKIVKPLSEEDRIIQAAERYHHQISGKRTESVVEKKSTPAYKTENSLPADLHGSGSERDLSVNIYTGNPGYYQTEGDTLNFWSFTPVPVDSLTLKTPVAEQPSKPYGFTGKPMLTTVQDWTFFLVIIGWTIFASLRFGFSKYMVQVFQSIFNYTAASRLFREQGYSSNFGLFRLNLIFYLFLPFSIFLIARDNGMSPVGSSGIEMYLIIFVAANAYFLFKIFLYKILGSVFSRRETTGELVFNMMLYHNVLGLILLPVATLHAMMPGFGMLSLFLAPVLIAIFYLMSIIRSIFLALREGVSIFYLILYLCALEILPILLVVKLATGG